MTTDFTKQLFASGTYLTQVGVPTAAVSRFYGRMGGSMSVFGGGMPCGTCCCDQYAIWDDRAAFRRQLDSMIAPIMNMKPIAESGGVTSSPSGEVNTNNYADCFNKLDKDKLKELQAKEAEINKLQAEFDAATGDDKKAKSKELKAAKESFSKLEKSFFGSTVPSDTYKSSEFKYSNLSEEELTQIHDANANIDDKKKEAEGLREQLLKKQSELEQKRNQIIQRGGNPDDVKNGISKTEIQTIDDMQARYNDLNKEISEQIDQLDKNIKKAGSSTESIDFDVAEMERSSSSKPSTGSQISSKMFKDGKLIARKAMEEIYTKDPYKKENADAVLDLIYGKCKEGASKEDIQKALTDADFLKEIQKSQKFDSTDANVNNVRLLEEVYDEIVGAGKFKEYCNEMKKSEDAGTKALAEELLKALEQKTEAKKTEEGEGTKADGKGDEDKKDNNCPKPSPVIDVYNYEKVSNTVGKLQAMRNASTPEEKTSILNSISDEDLIAALATEEDSANICDYFYDGSDDAEGIKLLTVRLNKICKDYNIQERLCIDSCAGWSLGMSKMRFEVPTRENKPISENTDANDIRWAGSSSWSVDSHLSDASYELAQRIMDAKKVVPAKPQASH